jgi:hypothetical protein
MRRVVWPLDNQRNTLSYLIVKIDAANQIIGFRASDCYWTGPNLAEKPIRSRLCNSPETRFPTQECDWSPLSWGHAEEWKSNFFTDIFSHGVLL